MKAVLVLIDSLNRHYLPCYNPDTVTKADNLCRFAAENITFDNHYLGSAPCMPARRDIFTGRLNFLERDWGPVEPYDVTMVGALREHGVFTHLVTDHPHYFDIGGENYCQMFDTWEYFRGQGGDKWVSRVEGIEMPAAHYGKMPLQNQLNRLAYLREEDHPTPRTFQSACDWLESNRGADDFFLMCEVFDPHEPFDCTEEYAALYGDDYDGPFFDWPSYEMLKDETGDAMEHLRRRYAGTLTMMDKWFGRLMQALKDTGNYDDTLIIVTTDHGHLLGEHGFAAKGFMHVYNELAHIPLMVHLPGGEGARARVNELTQNIDLMPTILAHFGVRCPKTVQGLPLRPVAVESPAARDSVIYGWFGKAVNITDGRNTYFRAPTREDNQPCYRYGAMPTTFLRYWEAPPADWSLGQFLPYTDHPVYRVRQTLTGHYPACPEGIDHVRQSLLFDIQNDPAQDIPLQDAALEETMIEKLRRRMADFDSPPEQYERLGI